MPMSTFAFTRPRAPALPPSPSRAPRSRAFRSSHTESPRSLPALIAAASFVLAITGRPASATDWIGFGLDAARSRATSEVIGTKFAPTWRSDLATTSPDAVYRALLASPAVADGYIAVASYGNTVRVLRESDGATLWETKLGDAVIASPTIDHGWLYVPCLDRNLYAFRLSDGQLIWKVDLGGITYSSPVVTAGSVVVAPGAPTPHVLRLDAETGTTIWSAGADLLRQSLDSSVVVAAKHVIVGETDGRFHSFAFADGQHEWLAETGGAAGLASPVVVGGRAYLPVGDPTARVIAVDLATGTPVPDWSVDFTSSIITSDGTGKVLARRIRLSSLAAVDGLILVDARGDDSIDTDKNGAADLFRLREEIIAIDATSGQVAWAATNGSLDASDPNQIPSHGLLPTPAIHRALTGEGLAVVASSLTARVSILDLGTGASRSSLTLPSSTRSSPVAANGRLILATDMGAIVALGSLDNSAPATPAGLSPGGGAASDAGGTVVKWESAMDFDGDAVTYQVRWDTDGEILHNAAGEAVTTGDATSWRLPALAANAVVTYAVRARDARGAWSAWSAPETFTTMVTPRVQVDSRLVASLAAALGSAQSGQVIRLGMGRYPLAETMRIPGGVTLQGAAPHLTVIDGQGLGTAVTISASDAEHPSTLRDLTVRGAATGVATGQGAHVLLRNVILADNTAFGIDVGASGAATVICATLYHNNVAARSFGLMDIRDSIVAANRRGLVATPAEALLSRYNDLFGNTEVDYENVVAGKGDLTRTVSFHAAESGDLRVVDESATTDHGDPGDDFSREPEPNGQRINIGAFAGTELAELSTPPGPSIGPPPGPSPGPTVGTSVGTAARTRALPVGAAGVATEPPVGHQTSGGGCTFAPYAPDTRFDLGLAGPLGTLGLGLALALAAKRRRRRSSSRGRSS